MAPVTPCAITALTTLHKEIFINCTRFLLTLCYFCSSHSSLMKTMPIQQIYKFLYFNLVTTKPRTWKFSAILLHSTTDVVLFLLPILFPWKFLLNWMYFTSAWKPPDISCKISWWTRDHQFRHSVTNSNNQQHVKIIFFTLRAWQINPLCIPFCSIF